MSPGGDPTIAPSTTPDRLERRLVLGLVAAALALRLGFALTVPVFQAPDERAHLDYVRFLIDEGRLPVQPRLTPEEALSGWPQSYQPPLAYLLYAPTAGAASAAGAGPGTMLRALRIQNALYGVLLVLVVYGIARRLRPSGDPLRLLAPAVVATLPGLCANAASVNNDGLANLLAASLWLAWLGLPGGARRGLAVGALFGAACLAKLTPACLAPLLLLAPWLERRAADAQHPNGIDPGALRETAVAAGVAALLLAPWLARNLALYGDPLAVGAGSFPLAQLAPLLPPDAYREVSTPAPGKALLQLVGRFGITNNLSWLPVTAVWLSLAALASTGWLRRSDAVRARDGWNVCFATAVLLGVVGLASFSLRYYGAWQGRYLYVCIAPIALLLAEGAVRGLGGRRLPVAGAAARHRRRLLVLVAIAAILVALDAALLWQLDAYFEQTPRELWGRRTSL